MWKHCDRTDEYISLHDCHATKISYEEGILTFGFEDGIWVCQGHPDNTVDKTVRTDGAEVRFQLSGQVLPQLTAGGLVVIPTGTQRAQQERNFNDIHSDPSLCSLIWDGFFLHQQQVGENCVGQQEALRGQIPATVEVFWQRP